MHQIQNEIFVKMADSFLVINVSTGDKNRYFVFLSNLLKIHYYEYLTYFEQPVYDGIGKEKGSAKPTPNKIENFK